MKLDIPRVSLGYLKSKSGDYIPISTVDRIFRQEINDFWNEQLSEKDKRQIINENYSLKSVATNMSTNPEEGDGWPIDPSCWVFGVRDGGDCGCCFNYSGPCWYCSLACYVHDQTCETCMPEIYCLPGCVPGPC